MIPSDDERESRSRHAIEAGALLVACLLAAGLVGTLAVAPALAGDNVAIVHAEPETVGAEPGEEFEIDVTLRSHGGYNDVGVERVLFRATYHPAYLEVTDVEPGGWLEQGDETEIETSATTAHDRGVAELAQRRNPPAGGASGIDTLATLSVRVPEDAPAANATLAFHRTELSLTNDYPQLVHERNATVVIAGGGDTPEPFDHGDLETIGDEETADDGGGGDDGDGDAGAIPGFTALAALVATAAALARLARG